MIHPPLSLKSVKGDDEIASDPSAFGLLFVGYTWISLDPASKIMKITWIVIGVVYYFIISKALKKNTDLEV